MMRGGDPSEMRIDKYDAGGSSEMRMTLSKKKIEAEKKIAEKRNILVYFSLFHYTHFEMHQPPLAKRHLVQSCN
jgi:hypothetical protein